MEELNVGQEDLDFYKTVAKNEACELNERLITLEAKELCRNPHQVTPRCAEIRNMRTFINELNGHGEDLNLEDLLEIMDDLVTLRSRIEGLEADPNYAGKSGEIARELAQQVTNAIFEQ